MTARGAVRRRAVAWIGGAAVLLALAAWGAAGDPRGDWRPVERGELVFGVEVAGSLEATRPGFLGAPAIPRQWDYKIELMAPEGSEVDGGEIVLRFDTSQLDRRLQESAAARDEAEAKLEKQRADFASRRMRAELELAEARTELEKATLKAERPPELVATVELRKAALELALAERAVDYRRRRLESLAEQERARLASLAEERDRAAERVRELEAAIARMTVTAPRAGPVIHVADRSGEKKNLGDTAWRGERILQIPDLSQMIGRGEVDEADAGRVTPGQVVRLRLDAYPDRELRGRVRVVGTAVRPRSQAERAKVVDIEIDLDRTDPETMRPAMRFRGEIEVGRSEPVLLAPAECVFTTPAGPRVHRRAWWGVESLEPRLGRRDGRAFEVLAGLAAGDLLSARDLEAR